MPRSRHRRLPKRPAPGPGSQTPGKKPLPRFDSIAEAKRFLATANLDDYDLSPVEAAAPPPPAEPEVPPAPRPSPAYEYAPKSARLTMRLPEALLQALKSEAHALGLPYQRLIREVLERAVGGR